MTVIGIISGDDRSLRSSCIHYVLMLCSGSLLKGDLSLHMEPAATGGRKKDGMQVLSISTYDYLRNTCLRYIYELELVPHRPRL